MQTTQLRSSFFKHNRGGVLRFACSTTRDHLHTTREEYCSDVHIISLLARPLGFGPARRLLPYFIGDCGKQYAPQDKCDADAELAASKLPAYLARLADNVAQLA